MAWQLTPYTVPLIVSSVVAAALTIYAIYHLVTREFEPSVATFAFLLGATTVYAVGYTLVLSSVDIAAKRQWLTLLWFGAASVPTAWFLFALTYAEREYWLTVPRLALLGIHPGVTFAVLLAEDTGLMWSDFTLDTSSNPFVTVEFALGPWYRLSILYSWVLITAGLVVLLWFVVRSDDLYRGQALALIVGGTTPFVANVVFFAGLYPHPNVNPTSAAFALAGAAYAVAVFRYRFLDVVPVATDAVVDRMRDGYVVVDDSGRIVDANPAATEFTDREDVVGEPVDSVFPFDLTGDSGPGEELSLHEGSREYVVGDSEPQFVEVRLSPLAGGRRAGHLLLLRDVTAERTVERRYQRLIERASDIIVVLDADGIVQYQSPSISRVLGWDPADVEGQNGFELVHPEDRDRVRERFDELVEQPGATDRIEYRVRQADGNWRTIESIVKNLLEDPFVEGVVLNGRDVTEHREREQKLEEQNERLDEFASVISHDLRNPLQIAQMNANLLESSDETEHIEHLTQALDRMEDLVNDVLALARQGESIRETQPVAVETIARQAWDTVDTDRATLSVTDERTLDADPDRLQQLFENCFRNAVEHGSTGNQNPSDSDDDGVHIEVGSRPDGGFYVADDGPGIPPEEREQVFESGYTTADDGTGFGLSIVEEIATAHGWTVSVTESAAGGARFEFVTDSE